MPGISNEDLIARAAALVSPKRIGDHLVGDVGCALITEKGNMFVGVCLDLPSGVGFCAEHTAIAAMVTAGEFRIQKIVAVWKDDKRTYVLSPCGRCREFMRQVDRANLQTEVVMDVDKIMTLAELLPYHDWFHPLS